MKNFIQLANWLSLLTISLSLKFELHLVLRIVKYSLLNRANHVKVEAHFPPPPQASLLVVSSWFCAGYLSKSELTSNAEHKVAEALTKEGRGHPAETQISHEKLQSGSSMNVP